jgi:hypothetical protein
MHILAVSISTGRKLGEIGFLLGALGALSLFAGGTGPDSRRPLKLAGRIGALLIAAGFVLGIAYVHWG